MALSCERQGAEAGSMHGQQVQQADSILVEGSAGYMGTTFQMAISCREEQEAAAGDALRRAFAEVERIEALMSSYREQSDISRINAGAGGAPVKVSDEIISIIQRAIETCHDTDGLLDLTFGPLGRLWDYHKRPFQLPDETAITRARQLVDCDDVLLAPQEGTVRLAHPGMSLGLGAMAKGYSVDRSSDLLEKAGFTHTMVNGGGDVMTRGGRLDRPWRVGIQDPDAETGVIMGSVSMDSGAIVTSGSYERYVEIDGIRYHHIIDPRTGWPARGLKSVSVMAHSAELADSLATAFFVAGPDGARRMLPRFPAVEIMLVEESGEIWTTPRFEEALTMSRPR